MIRSFRSRSVRAFWSKGDGVRIAPDLRARLKGRLDALASARIPDDMNVPAFDFHVLRGKPVRYSVHVNGPWCVTFGWTDDDAIDVDLENYH